MRDVTKLIEWLRSPETEVPVAQIPALLTQLASLQSELAGKLLIAASAAQTEYLPLPRLAGRTGMGKSTLRAMVKTGVFEEGVHFVRNGRRLLFRWPQVEDALRAHRCGARQPVAPVVEPFVRQGRRHGA